jgi:hypothetical protein
MKITRYFLILILAGIYCPAGAQYYYKDIVAPRQTQDTWKAYRSSKVSKVNILSTEPDGSPTPGFACSQTISPDYKSAETFTKSANVQASDLRTFYDPQGRVVKTIDSSDTYKSTTEYRYNEQDELVDLKNTALETDNRVEAVEQHLWSYQNGKPVQMLKIKGNSDTTTVHFKTDEKGNIIEERAVHGRESLPVIYYYYDDRGRLTDIVRYNEKAGRLLPDYMFEYGPQGLSSMLFVPPGSGDYQKWVYEYDDRGLKTRDLCFNKRKEMVARISYQYSFR